MWDNQYDVVVIGAGVSGIGMACQLTMKCPGKRVAILERRKAIGGTWDLFRYPGVRSDSDVLTYGFSFRPWTGTAVFADGPSIQDYLIKTAREYGIDKKVQFGLRVTQCEWTSAKQCWTVTAAEEASGQVHQFTCNFLVAATGYYNYDQGYLPEFPGAERFRGQCVHPQFWPETLDYRGKRIVVIGSGATAVTIVPAMANDAAHVTMLQRSPGYIFSFPSQDHFGAILQHVLPDRWIYMLLSRRNIFIQRSIYKICRRFPRLARSLLLASVRRRLGSGFDMSHFTRKSSTSFGESSSTGHYVFPIFRKGGPISIASRPIPMRHLPLSGPRQAPIARQGIGLQPASCNHPSPCSTCTAAVTRSMQP